MIFYNKSHSRHNTGNRYHITIFNICNYVYCDPSHVQRTRSTTASSAQLITTLIWYNHKMHETVTWGHCSSHKLSRAHARVSLHRGRSETSCEMTVISTTKHKEMSSSNDIQDVLFLVCRNQKLALLTHTIPPLLYILESHGPRRRTNLSTIKSICMYSFRI